MSETLTEERIVVQILHIGMKERTFKPELSAKVTWTANPKFQEYKLDTFITRRIRQHVPDNE